MKYLLKGNILLLLLILLTIISLFIGVSELSIKDLLHLTESQRNILFSSRIPRTMSILIAGSSLALAGLIMQRMMQNKFVSPTTAGTMEWAKLGILIALLLLPTSHILLKLVFAVICSICGTFLFVKIIDFIKVKDVIFALRNYDGSGLLQVSQPSSHCARMLFKALVTGLTGTLPLSQVDAMKFYI